MVGMCCFLCGSTRKSRNSHLPIPVLALRTFRVTTGRRRSDNSNKFEEDFSNIVKEAFN